MTVNRSLSPSPDPATVGIEIDGIRYLGLPTLIELKLASGMTNPGRLKDLADVQQLIIVLKLDRDFTVNLNPYVRDKFHDLWDGAQHDVRPEWRVSTASNRQVYDLSSHLVAASDVSATRWRSLTMTPIDTRN